MTQKRNREMVSVMAAEAPERSLILGFVDLGEDITAKPAKDYDIVSASSDVLANIAYPSSLNKRLSLDIYSLFVDDLPDWGANEGLLKVTIDTKNPQDLDGTGAIASFATHFIAEDGTYAPTFLYRGVFRNVILTEWVNLRFQLYELDTDVREYYKKVQAVIDSVPELKNLDVLNGIPYISLATKLFDSIIMQFGVNPDDVIWAETPILEFLPTPGGAFLRTGIYVLLETRNSSHDEIDVKDFKYRDQKIVPKTGIRSPNHLLFGVRITEHAAK